MEHTAAGCPQTPPPAGICPPWALAPSASVLFTPQPGKPWEASDTGPQTPHRPSADKTPPVLPAQISREELYWERPGRLISSPCLALLGPQGQSHPAAACPAGGSVGLRCALPSPTGHPRPGPHSGRSSSGRSRRYVEATLQGYRSVPWPPKNSSPHLRDTQPPKKRQRSWGRGFLQELPDSPALSPPLAGGCPQVSRVSAIVPTSRTSSAESP